jgi:general secretion pathway protein D
MPQAGGGARQYAYIDELGVIVATDSPRRLARIEALLEALIAEYNRARFIRLDVQHIAAPVARDRALQLIGVVQQPGAVLQPGVPGAQGGTARLENLGDRLTVDAQGNALLFRGLPDEIERVQEVLAVVDVPNTLQPVQYFAGTAAAQIAQLARERGLGEVSLFASDGQGVPGQVFDGRQNRAFNAAQGVLGTQSTTTTGGSVMIVDEARGIILYYATPTQHRQMDDLVRTLDTQSERVVIKTYKLNHQKAEDVAAIIQGLLNNQSLAGEAPLLPGGGQNTRGGLNPNRRTLRSIAQGSPQAGGGELSLDGTDSFVIPDEGNNQIVVKAPLGQQADFARLIEKLDLRKAQVYIEAKIVAVTADEGFRLAFETQLINASGTGGALNTNFGLGSFGTGGNFRGPKSVATGLAGLTAAVIKSDQIPIIMTALANTTDTRIIAAPQLLVDDNTEAEVVSVDEQPFTETTQTSGNPSQTSFAGFAEAGTTLTVTPQISPGGYLRLDYSAELSSFTGDPPSPGVPPPRQTNNLRGNVTVPGDFTVVVGGLTFDTSRKTVVKVPLLGDIPLVGLLFQDLRDSDRRTTLYLFLTPRILNEPNFEDLVLLSRGPQWEMLKTRDVPELKPTVIEVTPAPRDRAVLPWDAAVRRPEDDEGGGAQRDQGAEGAS